MKVFIKIKGFEIIVLEQNLKRCLRTSVSNFCLKCFFKTIRLHLKAGELFNMKHWYSSRAFQSHKALR